jgi:hypothetical protein
VLVTPEVVQEPDAQGVDMTAWNGGYFVANVTKDGFEIRLPGGGYCNGYGHCPYRVWFNWIVVGVEGESAESPSEFPVTTSPVVEPPPVTTPVTVEPPVVESSDVTSTEIIPDVTTSTDSGSVTTTADAPVTEPAPPADDSMLNLEAPVDQSSTDSAETTPSDTP